MLLSISLMTNTLKAQSKLDTAYLFKDEISIKLAVPKKMALDLYNKSVLYDSLVKKTDSLIYKIKEYENLIDDSDDIYEERLQNLEEQVTLADETIHKKDTIINKLKENNDQLVKEVKKEKTKRKVASFLGGSGIIIALILLIVI